MKHFHWLLITGIILLSAGCNAQDLSKSFVEITAGAGIPVGAFASKANNIKSGLAMNGIAIGVEYNHYFKRRLGYCFGLKRSVFPLDVNAWTTIPNTTSEPWRVPVVYGGFTSRKRFSEKTILSAKIGIGLATSKYPEATIMYNNPNPVVIHYTSSTGKAPAFILGTTLKYMLSQRIDLALNLDYLSTSPKFIVKRTVYSGQSSSATYLHYTQNMQAISVGLSLSYNFVAKE